MRVQCSERHVSFGGAQCPVPIPFSRSCKEHQKVATPPTSVKLERTACQAVQARSRTDKEPAVPGRLRRFAEEAQPSVEEQAYDQENRDCAVALARVAWDMKAEDISVLHVAPLVYWCSYMVVVNANSRPQLQAVISKVEREAKEKWGRSIEEEAMTSRGSSWEVLDFQDVVVHIFTPEQREFYDLDGYYGLAEEVELPFLDGTPSGLQWKSSL